MKLRTETQYNALAAWQLFFNGSLYAVFQVLNPVICDRFGGDEKTLASMVSAIFFGSVLIVLTMGEVAEHIGPRRVLVLVCCFDVGGTLLVAFARNIPMVIAGILLVGFGIGGSESNTYTLIEKVNGKNSERALLLANGAYGFGGFILPIVIENLFPENSFAPELLLYAVMGAGLVLCYLNFRALDGFVEIGKTEKKEGLAILRSLKNRVLLTAMIAMFLYCGMESVLTYWAVDVFEYYGSSTGGSYAVSAYWLATMLGSFLWGAVGDTLKRLPVLLAVGGVLTAAITVFPPVAVKVALMLLVGLCFGPSYSLISYIGGHACEESASGYSLMAFSASMGGAVIQPLVAMIVSGASAGAIYHMTFVMTLITAGLVCAAGRIKK